MNYSVLRYILGWLLIFLSGFLLLPMFVGIIYKEDSFLAFLITSVICLILGFLLSYKKPVNKSIYMREGFIAVSLSWLVMSIFGSLPFMLSGEITSFTDALFETISGFTTTGASILIDVESLSKASLFWRSFTHWIGGMGVFVFIMAILPLLGGSSMNLLRAESPGPSVGKLVPKIKDTAKILYSIYLFITILEIILLYSFGMNLFESFTITFGTVGTGGFGVRNSSLADYSIEIRIIVTIFMILSGVNYSLYFLILRKKFKSAFALEEVRWYFIIIFVAILLISFDIRNIYSSLSDILSHSAFQVGSIMTTTGYATTDFDLWPEFSKTILILLMFVGACAGSTAGGMKVARIVILFKTVKKELLMLLHPRGIKKIKMDGSCIQHEVVRATNVFVVSYFLILLLSVLLIGVDEFSFNTNFTAVAATLNNIGPGMELVGPTLNYSIFSDFSKFVLMFNMLAGRLEIFPVLLMLMPATWKKN